jgi:acyl dehydratase
MSSESTDTAKMKEALLSWRSEPMVFEVEKGAIRRYAEVLGDANPLWTDEAFARKSRYGGLIAMPIFLAYFNPFHWGVAKPFTGLAVRVSAGDAFEFYLPVRPGDRITVTDRFIDAYDKQGSKGLMTFTIDERTYTNQRGELVGKSHWTGIGWEPTAAPKTDSPAVMREPPPRFHEYARQRPPDFEIPATFPAAKQLFFEEVALGTEIPPLVRDLSHELFVRYAACSNDFSRNHVDYLYASAVGWQDCMTHGAMGTCYLGKLMTDWMGQRGTCAS